MAPPKSQSLTSEKSSYKCQRKKKPGQKIKITEIKNNYFLSTFIDYADDIELQKYYVTLMTEGSGVSHHVKAKMKTEDLTRVQHENNWKWKHPPKPDLLDLYLASVVD